MKLKNVAEVIFSFPVKDKDNATVGANWLTPTCLSCNNEILGVEKGVDWVVDEAYRIKKDDIVMKRVGPQFVNYISSSKDYLLGQNLALIRSTEMIYPKYLAYILENNLEQLYAVTFSRIPSIRRKDLEEIDIGKLPSMDIQEAIGELWWLQKEKHTATTKLLMLEELRLKGKMQEILNR